MFGGGPETVSKWALELGPQRIHLNSANIAPDIGVLRRKLNLYWNLIGVSYETQIVTFYASIFPIAAKTIILDSAFPLRRLDCRSEYSALACGL